MAEEQIAFRPRYSTDESSNEAYAEDLRQQRFRWRKKRATAVLSLLIGFIAVTVIGRIYAFISGFTSGSREGQTYSLKQTALARKESFGLIDYIPSAAWKQHKAASKKAVKLQDKVIAKTSDMLSESGANIDERKWWTQNWPPNFAACDNKKVQIGGKWLCQPRRIIDLADEYKTSGRRKKKKQRGNKECLIYISGGNDVEFGLQFLDFSLSRMRELHHQEDNNNNKIDLTICEIHIFNHYIPPEVLAQQASGQTKGVHFHPFAFRPEGKESMGVASSGQTATAFKTLKETVKELGHTGKSLSILAIDCEGCEWDIYRDILSADLSIQQVLMQLHGTPFIANKFFTAMHTAGYAIFHKEEVGGSGNVYDYSWVKLATSYFGSIKPNLRQYKQIVSVAGTNPRA